MFLEKSKSRIEAEFAKRAAEVPAVKEAEKEIETYRPEVALALKFLYTTMPLSDVGNYGVSSFLDYAEHGVFLWENSPYVKKMPGGDFPQLYPLSPDQHRGDPGLPEHFL